MNTSTSALLDVIQLALEVPGRSLVSALDWQVRAGEFWCVLGPNGVGKSTLLHAVAGLSSVAGGRILLDGAPLASIAPARLARQRGLLLQHQHDAFSLPVVDAVRAGRFSRADQWRGAAADAGPVLQALERVGLAHMATADLLTLSGGERQRVALATLLAQDPDLFLLDEPTSHQDIAAQLMIMRLLRELAAAPQRHAVIASCHDLNLAQRFATHILLLGPHGAHAGPLAEVMRTELLEPVFSCRFQVLENLGQRVLIAGLD